MRMQSSAQLIACSIRSLELALRCRDPGLRQILLDVAAEFERDSLGRQGHWRRSQSPARNSSSEARIEF